MNRLDINDSMMSPLAPPPGQTVHLILFCADWFDHTEILGLIFEHLTCRIL